MRPCSCIMRWRSGKGRCTSSSARRAGGPWGRSRGIWRQEWREEATGHRVDARSRLALTSAFHSGVCAASPWRRPLHRFCGWTHRVRVRRPRRRSGWSEVAVQFGLGEVEFNLVEGFKRVAEVDQDQVALCPSSEKRAVCAGHRVFLSNFKSAERPRRDAVAVDLRVARQAFQSKRKNWWSSAEPSRVSGTGGKSDNGSTRNLTNSISIVPATTGGSKPGRG